jgi:dinuclear metal center YbgI/SA1388 family protein
MVTRDELTSFIETTLGSDLLTKARLKDIYSNGVQIHGVSEVNKIVLGVTLNHDFLVESVAAGAEFCLTHHGLDLTNHNLVASRIHAGLQADLRYIFDHELTVAGYHYSLDAHTQIGNNATIISELGAKMTGETYYDEWGYVAQFKTPIPATELASKLADLTSHDIFTVYGGPKMIKRIGVCSGGAKPYDRELFEIIDKQIDAHIAGEIIEPSIAQAKGVGYNYYSCGHYATEVFGVQELVKKIKAHFKNRLEVEFIDIPNPL